MKLYFHTAYLDAKQLELLQIFFLNDSRAERIYSINDADYEVLDARAIHGIPLRSYKKYIVIDYYDIPNKQIGLRGKMDSGLRVFVQAQNIDLFYIKQAYYHIARKKDIIDSGIVLLSIPIFFNGSITYRDLMTYDRRGLILENIIQNPKNWEFQFCFINCDAGNLRMKVYRRLINYSKSMGFRVCPRDKFVGDAVVRITKAAGLEFVRQGMDRDLDSFNEIPFDKLIDLHRKSKVAIGCEGNSAFCAKDSEMLSRNVFYLRSYHKDFDVNPLSPKDGKHLVFFTTDLEDKLSYYLTNDDERERINDSGFEYFKEGATGGWAKAYVDMFEGYLSTKDKNIFKPFMIYKD